MRLSLPRARNDPNAATKVVTAAEVDQHLSSLQSSANYDVTSSRKQDKTRKWDAMSFVIFASESSDELAIKLVSMNGIICVSNPWSKRSTGKSDAINNDR